VCNFYIVLLQAVCCSDKLHCCPSGYTCDTSSGTCTKDAHSMSWNAVAVRNVAKATPSNVVCPGGTATCPAGTTCCESEPLQYSCCPTGYTCDSSSRSCIMDVHYMSRNAVAVKDVDKPSPNSVECPDGKSECPDGCTCCQMESGEYGCCPFAQVYTTSVSLSFIDFIDFPSLNTLFVFHLVFFMWQLATAQLSSYEDSSICC